MKKEDITYEIIKNLGVISKTKSGWTTEVNVISWNGKEPVIDVRSWSPDKSKLGKGITFTKEERTRFIEIVQKYDEENEELIED